MQKNLRILAVDDEPLIRRAFLLAGNHRGHKVKVASNGKRAMELWLRFDPELVFLDVMLPDMSGFQVLKSLPKNQKAKCVMISANDDFQEEINQANGFHLFVQKPFEDIFEILAKGERLVYMKSISSIWPEKSQRIGMI